MIYGIAGYIGVNPDPYSMRELWWMRDGKDEYLSDQTSKIMAMMANLNRNPKDHPKPFQPGDFHEYMIPVSAKGNDIAVNDDPSTWSDERKKFEQFMYNVEVQKGLMCGAFDAKGSGQDR